jgi:hypothetical protein
MGDDTSENEEGRPLMRRKKVTEVELDAFEKININNARFDVTVRISNQIATKLGLQRPVIMGFEKLMLNLYR